VSNELFREKAVALATSAEERYIRYRRDAVVHTIEHMEPSGDAEFDGLQRQVFEAELLHWDGRLRLTFFCRRKLEK